MFSPGRSPDKALLVIVVSWPSCLDAQHSILSQFEPAAVIAGSSFFWGILRCPVLASLSVITAVSPGNRNRCDCKDEKSGGTRYPSSNRDGQFHRLRGRACDALVPTAVPTVYSVLVAITHAIRA